MFIVVLAMPLKYEEAAVKVSSVEDPMLKKFMPSREESEKEHSKPEKIPIGRSVLFSLLRSQSTPVQCSRSVR